MGGGEGFLVADGDVARAREEEAVESARAAALGLPDSAEEGEIAAKNCGGETEEKISAGAGEVAGKSCEDAGTERGIGRRKFVFVGEDFAPAKNFVGIWRSFGSVGLGRNLEVGGEERGVAVESGLESGGVAAGDRERGVGEIGGNSCENAEN